MSRYLFFLRVFYRARLEKGASMHRNVQQMITDLRMGLDEKECPFRVISGV